MKQTQGVQDTPATAKLHADAAQIFRRICVKLDALSNQNYVPLKFKQTKARKLGAEPATVAAITMEEVTPVAVSEAVALAPEEIYKKSKHEVRGESEVTGEEKAALRRQRKEQDRKKKEQRAQYEREELIRNPKKKDALQSTEKAMAAIKGARNVTIAEGGGGGKQHRTGGGSGDKYNSTAFFGRLQAAQESGGLPNAKKRPRPQEGTKPAQFKL